LGKPGYVKIIVCIKQVPESPTFEIKGGWVRINREGVPSVVNPLDLNALEGGLSLRKRHGGEVIAISMGPPQCEEGLREALAMGVDRAILLSDRRFAGADTLATSYVLAKTIDQIGGFDLIICGAQTIDSDTGQVGPQIAEQLGIPHIAYVERMKWAKDRFHLERVCDGFVETISVTLPALITVSKRLNTPRRPSLGGIEDAFASKSVQIWDLDKIKADPRSVGEQGSATWVRRLHPPPDKRTAEMVTGNPMELADLIYQKLIDRNIVEE
jgi:electron transfer flavoprotein beta subunit